MIPEAAWLLAGVLGAVAGLVPGIHPNVAAALVLAAAAAPPTWAPPLLAFAAGHLFGALVASAFWGTADPDAGTVDVGGREHAELACLGAFVGVVAAFPAAAALRFVLGAPLDLYAHVRTHAWLLLIALVLFTVLRERPRPKGPAKALLVVAATGSLGSAAFALGAASPLGVPASPLLPLFAGLFAAPGLLAARKAPKRVPNTPAAPPRGWMRRTAFASGAAGSVLGLLPGVTAGHASALLPREGVDVDELRLRSAAVAGAGLVFALVVALALGPARSGALAAAQAIDPADWRAWTPSAEAARWAAATLAGAGAGCACMLWAAPRLARAWRRMPRDLVLGWAAAVLLAVVGALNGAVGLLVFAVAAVAGHLPAALGVSRVHAMGVILVPTVVRLVPQ